MTAEFDAVKREFKFGGTGIMAAVEEFTVQSFELGSDTKVTNVQLWKNKVVAVDSIYAGK